jgi:hypothetical protein
MPAYFDVEKLSEDPAVFRQIARELRDLPYSDWRPWEEYVFIPAMLRYSDRYIFSEKERRKLAELCWFADEVYDHDGISVERMVEICLQYHTDFLESDSDWIVDLNRRGAKFVRRRQIKELAALCRLSGVDLRAA